VKPRAEDGDEESEPETEADATTRPHRLDVLA
jgi:hypothetical protein